MKGIINSFKNRYMLSQAVLFILLFLSNSIVCADESIEKPWIFSSQPFGLITMAELVKPPPPDKNLFLKITTGYQYDTNVILNAPGIPIPEDIGKKDDSRLVFNLSGSYLPFKSSRGDVALNYAFFQSQHAELDDFNVTQNLAEIAGKYRIDDRYTIRYSTVFQHLLLGSKLFDYAVVTGPSMTIHAAEGQTTNVDFRYRSTEYENVSIFKNNSIRSGSNYSGAITHSIFFSPSTVVRVGYTGDVDKTRSSLWDGVGHKVNFEGSLILGKSSMLDIYGEYYRKDYEGIYSSIGGKRHDDAWSGVVTTTTYFEDKYGVSLRCLYTRNISNVPAFNISRVIPSILFDVRF